MLYDFLFAPFGHDLPFMRRALTATLALSLGYGPVGVFLVLRRMTLVTDAMAHAILPGAAVGFLLSGLSLWAMSVGGLVAGLVVALLSGAVSRATKLREDASFAGFYLVSLALGVMLLSMGGNSVDLVHILFGSVLAVDDAALYLMAGAATLTLLAMAVIYRPLLIECLDPTFIARLRRARRAVAPDLPRAADDQHGVRIPGAGNFDGGRPDGASGRDVALLGAPRRPALRGGQRTGHGQRLFRAAAVLSCRTAVGPRHRADGRHDLVRLDGRGPLQQPALAPAAAPPPGGLSPRAS